MHKRRACHCEDVPIASLNDAVGLGDARVRSLMEQTKCAACCSNLLTIVGVHCPDWPTSDIAINRQGGAVPVFTAHGVAHFQTCGDVLHDEEMATIIAPHGPIGISLDHVIAC